MHCQLVGISWNLCDQIARYYDGDIRCFVILGIKEKG